MPTHDANSAGGTGPDELIRMAHIASRHYRDGLTRIEIAEEFGISRFKVGRLLEKARELKIVRVEISPVGPIDLELSVQLRQRFGLKRALAVITQDAGGEILRQSLGSATAQLLSEILEEGELVGLAAGRTLNSMAAQLTAVARCDAVGLGGVAAPEVEHGIEVIRKFSRAARGRSWPIFAPLLVETPQLAASLRQDPHIAQAYSRFKKVTTGLVAIGSWDPPDSQLYDAATTFGMTESLVEHGVAGEILATLYDREGNVIEALRDHSLAMTTEQLRQVPEVIGIAGGLRKTAAVRGAIRAGLIDSLVTDEHLARRLLEEA